MTKCHVLGHVQPCKAALCAEIEREHQAVRCDVIEECARALDAEWGKAAGMLRMMSPRHPTAPMPSAATCPKLAEHPSIIAGSCLCGWRPAADGSGTEPLVKAVRKLLASRWVQATISCLSNTGMSSQAGRTELAAQEAIFVELRDALKAYDSR